VNNFFLYIFLLNLIVIFSADKNKNIIIKKNLITSNLFTEKFFNLLEKKKYFGVDVDYNLLIEQKKKINLLVFSIKIDKKIDHFSKKSDLFEIFKNILNIKETKNKHNKDIIFSSDSIKINKTSQLFIKLLQKYEISINNNTM
jgi:hypothetical protein